ncbi:adenosylcobinamide-GDP ribazoletransferase [Thiocapsa sp.]|uniref:adenosylcobinamide-GDP ribazoletransferase n=1 Tax=Thiocapsa sp. TaxID=2024551 RepID=UPI0025DF7AA6|nr:adenosylcobinamide-GDP ribazoletransferase [Thiocapsa sp.]
MDLRPLWLAGRLLTRLPFPEPSPFEPRLSGLSVPWYPAIGVLLGVLIALAGTALATADPGVAASCVLILWVWSTGALHLDGLADSADAWVGGIASRERTLEIMKDPRSGPAAVTAIGLVLIAKWAGIQALIASGSAWILLLIPLLARAQLPLLMLTTPYARAQGMASEQMAQLPRRAAWAATLIAGIVSIAIAGWIGLALCLMTLAVFGLSRRTMMSRIAGFTGDTAGALVEITETGLLLAVVLAATLIS